VSVPARMSSVTSGCIASYAASMRIIAAVPFAFACSDNRQTQAYGRGTPAQRLRELWRPALWQHLRHITFG